MFHYTLAVKYDIDDRIFPALAGFCVYRGIVCFIFKNQSYKELKTRRFWKYLQEKVHYVLFSHWERFSWDITIELFHNISPLAASSPNTVN